MQYHKIAAHIWKNQQNRYLSAIIWSSMAMVISLGSLFGIFGSLICITFPIIYTYMYPFVFVLYQHAFSLNQHWTLDIKIPFCFVQSCSQQPSYHVPRKLLESRFGRRRGGEVLFRELVLTLAEKRHENTYRKSHVPSKPSRFIRNLRPGLGKIREKALLE